MLHLGQARPEKAAAVGTNRTIARAFSNTRTNMASLNWSGAAFKTHAVTPIWAARLADRAPNHSAAAPWRSLYQRTRCWTASTAPAPASAQRR